MDNKINLIIIGVSIMLIGTYISNVNAQSLSLYSAGISAAAKMVEYNTKIHKFTQTCIEQGENEDKVKICDVLFQKTGIELGKFFIENQYSIESIIYPMTIPFEAFDNSKKNVAGV